MSKPIQEENTALSQTQIADALVSTHPSKSVQKETLSKSINESTELELQRERDRHRKQEYRNKLREDPVKWAEYLEKQQYYNKEAKERRKANPELQAQFLERKRVADRQSGRKHRDRLQQDPVKWAMLKERKRKSALNYYQRKKAQGKQYLTQ